MCKCTPSIRTQFCGKPGCEYPGSKPEGARVTVPAGAVSDDLLDVAAMLENELAYERNLLEKPDGGGSRIAVGRHERWLAAVRGAISDLTALRQQLAEMLGAVQRAEMLCDSIGDMRPGSTFNTAAHRVDACAETAREARYLLRAALS